MNRDEQFELLLAAAKGELSPDQKAVFEQLLARDSAFRESWEQERALHETLAALPNAPMSSNFTARVLEAVDLHDKARRREARRFVNWVWSWPTRLAAVGVACLALVLGLQHNNQKRRADLATALNALSDVTTVLAPNDENPSEGAAFLRDFDTIARLSNMPEEQELDLELLVALQK